MSHHHHNPKPGSLDSHFNPAGGGVHYGLLRGTVVKFGTEDGTTHPHFQIIVDDKAQIWRIAVNVRSDDGSNDQAVIVNPLSGVPILGKLAAVPVGFADLPGHVSGLALDFVREPLFKAGNLQSLPPFGAEDGKDIEDLLSTLTQRAIDEAGHGSELYVWGSKFVVGTSPTAADTKFGNKVGVHDVHMNQGNPPPHAGDNGKFQDGGLIFHFVPANLYVGVFMKFQSQEGKNDAGAVVLPKGGA